jgi:hypothetical protein
MKFRNYEEFAKHIDDQVADGSWFKKFDKPAEPVPVLTVPVSDETAANIQSNPESVRIYSRAAGAEVGRTEGPRPNSLVTVRVDRVRAVDADARPVWDTPGVVSDYNPLDALKRPGDR